MLNGRESRLSEKSNFLFEKRGREGKLLNKMNVGNHAIWRLRVGNLFFCYMSMYVLGM